MVIMNRALHRMMVTENGPLMKFLFSSSRGGPSHLHDTVSSSDVQRSLTHAGQCSAIRPRDFFASYLSSGN